MSEVLVAIGIFALGFVAVAAVFPSAALMQRETREDVDSRNLERSARAIIGATSFTYAYDSGAGIASGNLGFYHNNGGEDSHVKAFPPEALGAAPSQTLWSLDARSYPTSVTDPFLRDYHWVPLLRDAEGDANSPNWEIYVFVLGRKQGNYVREGDADAWANYEDGCVPEGADCDEGDTWFVPGVRNQEVEVVLTGPNANRRFLFDNYNTNDPDIDPSPPNDPIYWLLKVNDRLLHERTGQMYRVVAADAEGVTVDSPIRIGDDPADEQHIWYAHSHRNINGRDEYRVRPTKRLFMISNVEYKAP